MRMIVFCLISCAFVSRLVAVTLVSLVAGHRLAAGVVAGVILLELFVLIEKCQAARLVDLFPR